MEGCAHDLIKCSQDAGLGQREEETILSKVKTEKHIAEAQAGFTHRTAIEEAARCLLCHDSPCSESCPAGTDPGKFIRSIRFRNAKGAAETIRENNVLGGTCARVCPYDRLCEEACSRCGIDKPIQIGKLQRYAIEQEKQYKMKILKAPLKKNKEQIACVGAGPASVACAAELAKQGYRVTVFEKNPKAGGVLTYGIAEVRLPQKVVDQDLAAVKGLGVRFEYGKEIGSKITIEDLLTKKGFDAVFIGAGLWGGRKPDIRGAELKNVLTASDFLASVRDKENKIHEKMKDKDVCVIGGGDVAIDAAVAAKLIGASHSMIWYRRTLEEAPASMSEILFAVETGVSFMTNYAPKQFTGKTKVEYAEFIGRDKKSSARVAADYIILATGQSPADFSILTDLKLTEKGLIEATKMGVTSVPAIFAAGDAVSGGYSVVESVRDGKLAAYGIIDYLSKKGVK
jgi:dihydropyrimidine dehydrogenase (NAD+) subunit PreT